MAETEVQQATLACNLFNKGPVNRQFTVTFIEEKDLYTNQQPLKAFLDSVSSPSAPLGIAGAYTQCTEAALKDQTAYLLTKIAVATPENVLVISLHFYDEDRPIPPVNHAYLEAALFPTDDTSRQYVGFNVDRLALQLFGEYGLFIRNGIDILSIGVEHIDTTRTIARFIKLHKGLVDTACLTDLVREEWDLDDESDNKLAVRAWVGAVLELASETIALRMANTPPINVSPEPLKIEEWIKLQNVMLSSDRLRGSAPDFVEHDMEVVREAGKFFALSNQFNSRVRVSDFDLEVTFENDVVRAQTVKTKGKKTELKLTEKIDLKEAGQIVKAVTLGKEEATTLDHQRSNFILFALQGRVSIRDNPLLRYIWFPDTIPKASLLLERPLLHGEEFKKLNRSQKTAVNEMLVESPDPRIVLVHGPPGTGKTSVIAAMTQCILLQEQENDTQEDKEAPDDRKREKYEHEDEEEEEEKEDRGPTVWIVAQSNVAVKNVAEKLLKVGIYEFKLIVSQEFHFEWHEHLYEKIKNNMCTSALLPKNSAEVKTFLGDARVILCTLSMLTHPRLRQLGFHTIVPVENVVVDEASQIQLGDLLPMLHIFGSDIKRLCMVGDHKQLAPYGQEQVQGIESIFEIDHIVNSKDSTTTLLSITYRLPKPICNIISTEVYNRSLIPNSTEQRSTCCKWIDVDGEEETDGTSYKNDKEIDACILLAKELENKGKEYRIISPYAPQTTRLLARLKEENMNWEDKCFNVDSFQGNEADYIIISLVRTNSMGFLDNNRRANVLLTRCKKGMYVVCSRNLMLGERASGTLLGKFAFSWTSSQENSRWPTFQDLVDGKEMVDEDLTPPPPVSSSSPTSHRTARKEKQSNSKQTTEAPRPKKGKKKK